MQGRSLTPLLSGKQAAWRDSFLIEYYSDKVFPRIAQMGYKAIRNQRWKYIHYLELEGADELYDLKNDPYEMKNLIDYPAAQKDLAALKQELDRLMRETNAGGQGDRGSVMLSAGQRHACCLRARAKRASKQ
jgi:N-acetylglucosamine-6-sulfatase